jgi:hypothetical protein
MARFQFVVLTRAAPGREAEFDDWYDNRHLPDVVAVEGVVSARRFNIEQQSETDFAAPSWRSLAIYELEADDPQRVIAAISAAANTDAMMISESLSREGLVTLVATPRGSAG